MSNSARDFAISKPLEYLTFSHAGADFHMGLLRDPTPVFCSAQPHRPIPGRRDALHLPAEGASALSRLCMKLNRTARGRTGRGGSSGFSDMWTAVKGLGGADAALSMPSHKLGNCKEQIAYSDT
jgi:hypothetical protein